jgi:single-stranded-DNA-specific exonuclease
MEKLWVIKDKGDKTVTRQLSLALGLPESIAGLMVQRGLVSPADARAFFDPSLDDLHDPFRMKDMNRAVDRISSAIAKNERILVYGDYDVDGTTSVAMMYSFLANQYTNLDYYIPDRYDEGYGISLQGIDYAVSTGCRLIIALDCGIKAVEKVRYARSKGLDIIICDHHFPGESVPEATAVLDPKQPGCSYPYKELSGCGVGFKLIQAYCRIHSKPAQESYDYLDLVAVSIASDIVPITGENRILAFYGLKKLNDSPRTGLREIIRESDINRKVTIEDVVFRIGPRINAAGRMESGRKAVELLISDDSRLAGAMSRKISDCNNERRNVDRIITAEAMRMISEDLRRLNSRTTVLYNPQWHKGVIGIVASRLIETYYRPTVILTESNGFATGSARSVPGYDLYQAIEACSDLLESFGGHMYAAGLTLKKENLEEFIERFEKHVAGTISDDQLVPRVFVDAELSPSEINMEFYSLIEKFQPFGPENMAPIFLSANVYDTGNGKMVGQNGEHLKLEICHESTGTKVFHAIAFGQSHRWEHIRSNKPFDICYSLEINDFRGSRTLQLNIRDIRPARD